MANLKNLTILHSNDMHGDFMPENLDEVSIGGVSMLSGYIRKVKSEIPTTLYCVSGDMLQGSIIDSEFRGLSTIEIMNLLQPDIASLGNHEIDYGLGHLLLLERCSRFPIVNANLYIRNPYTRLFDSHRIIEVDGMKIMFIGIITKEVLSSLKMDMVLGSIVDVAEAANEVGRICDSYRTTDIDFTVLLTHIGFEEDKQLASLLDPAWGVDIIIGGHSHTVLEKPEEVNGVLIVQAGVGTDQIGRFDITINTDLNAVSSYEWQLIPIDSKHCPRDEATETAIYRYKQLVDDKYARVICNMVRALHHPVRNRETELGNLLSDLIQTALQVDIAMIGSGSIRSTVVGPIITLYNLMEMLPYDDIVYQIRVTGSQFKRIYRHILRDNALDGNHTEFYQFSKGLNVTFDTTSKKFTRFDFKGEPINEEAIFSVAIQGFHRANIEEFFGIKEEEIEQNGKIIVLSTSFFDVILEHLSIGHSQNASIEGRLILI